MKREHPWPLPQPVNTETPYDRELLGFVKAGALEGDLWDTEVDGWFVVTHSSDGTWYLAGTDLEISAPTHWLPCPPRV